ncbi:hypothetical protein [Microbacterium sp. ET2]|uniref:hypothetical protein n=1 Tax=Microbacterium albipurpureum TaxID=3050384 RepID=UPI002FDE6BCB
MKAVQRMLGHGSAAMTLDTYADLFDDELDCRRIAPRRRDAARGAAGGSAARLRPTAVAV